MTRTVYGIVLNDAAQVAAMGDDLHATPYLKPPVAPVLYIKPRTCIQRSGCTVEVPATFPNLDAAATLALEFGGRPGVITAAALALDVSEPHDNFYRPAIRQRCRDGFLPLGDFSAFTPALATARIDTIIDETLAHSWSLDRLIRNVDALVQDVGAFMTLADGDILLVGLAGDAPRAGPGQHVRIESPGLPPLDAGFVAENVK